MQTVKFVYSGSATRKFAVMGREQVIVSGDDKSTQFIFKFPDCYKDYSKEIIWSGFIITQSDGTEIAPRYPLDNDTFYVPQEVTVPNAGKEISFQIRMYKPQDEEVVDSFDIIETSLEFPIYISKTVEGLQVSQDEDSLSEIIAKALIKQAYDVDAQTDRPVIIFSTLTGVVRPVILNMPYLVGGKIPDKFLPFESETRVINYDTLADMIQDTEAVNHDIGIITVGTGTLYDYPNNVYMKTTREDENNGWILLYSQYITDEQLVVESEITQLQTDVSNIEDQIGDDETPDTILYRITTNEGNIQTNTENIQTNTENIQTNTEDIQTNAQGIQDIVSEIGTEQTPNTILQRIKTNEDNIQTNTSDIQTNAGDISDIKTEIGAEQTSGTILNRIKTSEDDIDALEGRMNTAEGDIDSLEGRMGTAEGDINTLEGKMSTAEAKLDTIESGAEVNVQQNWNEQNTSSDQYIQNKPTLGTQAQLDQTQDSEGAQDAGKVAQLDESGKLDSSLMPQYVSSVNTRSGQVTLTKSDVGLANTDNGAKQPVDNLTSSTNPPLASTVGTAVDGKIGGLSGTITGGKILVSVAGESTEISESAYAPDNLQYLTGVTGNVQSQIDSKVTKNADVVAGTKTKITYDQKGLVTGGQDLVQSDIPDLSSIYQVAGNYALQSDLQAEQTARGNADNNLQEQIDAIQSKSDVVDVVQTYEDLLQYDTSSLGNNDIIKVLSDSQHNNQESYYRWVITQGVGAWEYIGSLSASYTKQETDQLLSDKMNTSMSNGAIDPTHAGKFMKVSSTGGVVFDTPQTYSPGTGLSLDTTTNTFNHSNAVTAQSTYKGGATEALKIQYDQQGHVTQTSTDVMYPPTTQGTSGQVWKSKGSGQGEWATPDQSVSQGSFIPSSQAVDSAISDAINTPATQSNLGTVKSSSIDGEIQVDQNGVMSLNGYMGITSDISQNASDISDLQISVGNSTQSQSSTGTLWQRIKYAISHIGNLETSVGTSSDTESSTGSAWARIKYLFTHKQDNITPGTGLEFDAQNPTTLNHSNSVTQETTGVGSQTQIPKIKYDSEGHITEVTTATVYPPTTQGTAGQVWKSQGSGVGTWESQSNLSVGHATSADSATSATSAGSATSATDQSYAQAVGTSSSQPQIGSATQPVYVAQGGTVTAGTALSDGAYKAMGSVATGNTGLVTGGDVYSAISNLAVLKGTAQNPVNETIYGVKTYSQYIDGVARKTIEIPAINQTQIDNGAIFYKVSGFQRSASKIMLEGYSRNDYVKIQIGIGGFSGNEAVDTKNTFIRTDAKRRIFYGRDANGIYLFISGISSSTNTPMSGSTMVISYMADVYNGTSSELYYNLVVDTTTPVTLAYIQSLTYYNEITNSNYNSVNNTFTGINTFNEKVIINKTIQTPLIQTIGNVTSTSNPYVRLFAIPIDTFRKTIQINIIGNGFYGKLHYAQSASNQYGLFSADAYIFDITTIEFFSIDNSVTGKREFWIRLQPGYRFYLSPEAILIGEGPSCEGIGYLEMMIRAFNTDPALDTTTYSNKVQYRTLKRF